MVAAVAAATLTALVASMVMKVTVVNYSTGWYRGMVIATGRWM
jgi:hypothetical protein